MSGTLVALSHSIRLRPGAHTGAECVLRATYQRRGSRKEAGKAEKDQIDGRRKRKRSEETIETQSSRGESSGARVKRRTVVFESGGEQRPRWQRGLL